MSGELEWYRHTCSDANMPVCLQPSPRAFARCCCQAHQHDKKGAHAEAKLTDANRAHTHRGMQILTSTCDACSMFYRTPMHKSGTFWEKNVVKFLDKDQQVALHSSSERACGRRVARRVAGCFLGCLGSGHASDSQPRSGAGGRSPSSAMVALSHASGVSIRAAGGMASVPCQRLTLVHAGGTGAQASGGLDQAWRAYLEQGLVGRLTRHRSLPAMRLP